MKRLKIAQFIALGATILSVIGAAIGGFGTSDFGMTLLVIGFFAGIVSYCFGGLFKALSMAMKIAKWGWIAIPFPFGFFIFPVTFFVAIVALVFLPIIPVRKAYKESMIKNKI